MPRSSQARPAFARMQCEAACDEREQQEIHRRICRGSSRPQRRCHAGDHERVEQHRCGDASERERPNEPSSQIEAENTPERSLMNSITPRYSAG